MYSASFTSDSELVISCTALNFQGTHKVVTNVLHNYSSYIA